MRIVNIISTWLYLIGTAERARKLRLRVDGLVSPPLDELYGMEPVQCPTTVLFGAAVSRRLYVDPVTRLALDAWDTGIVSKSDIRRWCQEIEKGRYQGPIFEPTAFWQDAISVLVANQQTWLRKYNLDRLLRESQESIYPRQRQT